MVHIYFRVQYGYFYIRIARRYFPSINSINFTKMPKIILQ